MKTRILYVLISLTVLLSSCEKIELGKSFDCHMGEYYKVTRDLSFIIDSLNDSRCPENCVCAWEGEVHLFVNINIAHNIVDTVLYQDPTGKYPFLYGGYNFSVLDVHPISTGTRTSKDIRIKMLITRI